jgi:hypothetical protein
MSVPRVEQVNRKKKGDLIMASTEDATGKGKVCLV